MPTFVTDGTGSDVEMVLSNGDNVEFEFTRGATGYGDVGPYPGVDVVSQCRIAASSRRPTPRATLPGETLTRALSVAFDHSVFPVDSSWPIRVVT